MADTKQIIPYYAHPHVHTEIIDNTWYSDDVEEIVESSDLPYSTLVVTAADQGIDNTFVRLSDIATKKSIFGKGNFSKYGQASLQADYLFSGSTNVWFCRVLPDNATYANMILMASYRKGSIRDDLDQETGLKRLEIKFSVAYAAKPALSEGATDDDAILALARSLETATADPQTGYCKIPIAYIRSIGRGKYGNKYSFKITRDASGENENEVKCYSWNLIQNSDVSRVINSYSGSLYQATKYNVSTLISDVLDQYATGMCPIKIYPFEDSFNTLYEYYQNIVEENAAYLATAKATEAQMAELTTARAITEKTFDPLFGYVMNTKTSEIIPYYRNYTTKLTGEYVKPDLQVSNYAKVPTNIATWNTVEVGMAVLVLADENNGGLRWRYTVESIDDAGNIFYDEGVECAIDDEEYDGLDIAASAGVMLSGGHDGDFQEVTGSDGSTRVPTTAEMKLLIAREQVKALRGQKDARILSPYRIDLDFIFDANYNMTSDGSLEDNSLAALYSNSTVLTDSDYQQLAVVNTKDAVVDTSDINVKQALFDLNRFRNRNGMTVGPDLGAGCHLYLDCGLIGLKSIDSSSELQDTIDMFSAITGRDVSIDFGSYDIYDPYTGKRISVTVDYFIALNLVDHIMRYGLNKPFASKYARMTAIQTNSTVSQVNAMIRDSFRPDIDIIDWDVKESLYNGRFNYYISSNEGRLVERAAQNTRQLDASCLLEENNARVLNTLKKGLDEACRGYLYEWNEPEQRKGYTDSQMAIYKPWIGTMVQDINIYFDANEWEQKRMIMHCYCDVAFRDIVKRVILEININRADYSNEGGES